MNTETFSRITRHEGDHGELLIVAYADDEDQVRLHLVDRGAGLVEDGTWVKVEDNEMPPVSYRFNYPFWRLLRDAILATEARPVDRVHESMRAELATGLADARTVRDRLLGLVEINVHSSTHVQP
jgi:hypothetical protein